MGTTLAHRFLGMTALLLLPLFADTVYRTYGRWEPDGLLAAWVIHRYVDPRARFEAVPKGRRIEQKTAINTAGALFRRTGRETAYESTLRHFGIDDACTRRFIPVIRLLEMVPWKKVEDPSAVRFEKELRRRLEIQGMAGVFGYLDRQCIKETK